MLIRVKIYNQKHSITMYEMLAHIDWCYSKLIINKINEKTILKAQQFGTCPSLHHQH